LLIKGGKMEPDNQNKNLDSLTDQEKNELNQSLGPSVGPKPLSNEEQHEIEEMAIGGEKPEPKPTPGLLPPKPTSTSPPAPAPTPPPQPQGSISPPPKEKPQAFSRPVVPKPEPESKPSFQPTRRPVPKPVPLKDKKPKSWLPTPVRPSQRITAKEVGSGSVPAQSAPKQDVVMSKKRPVFSALGYALIGLVVLIILFFGLAYVDAAGILPTGINNVCKSFGMSNGCLSFLGSAGGSPTNQITSIRKAFESTTSHQFETTFTIALTGKSTAIEQPTVEGAKIAQSTEQQPTGKELDQLTKEELGSDDTTNTTDTTTKEKQSTTEQSTKATEQTTTTDLENVITGTASGTSSSNGVDASINLDDGSNTEKTWQDLTNSPIQIIKTDQLLLNSAGLMFNGWIDVIETDYLSYLDFLTLTSAGIENLQKEAVSPELDKFTMSVPVSSLTLSGIGDLTAADITLYASTSDNLPQEIDFKLTLSTGSIEINKKYTSFNDVQEMPESVNAKREITSTQLIELINGLQKTIKQRDTDRKADLAQIQSAIEAHKQEKGDYPTSNGVDEIDRANSTVSQLLVPSFITSIPSEVLTDRYYYGYISANGKDYTLSCVMENSKDSDAKKAGSIYLYSLGSQ